MRAVCRGREFGTDDLGLLYRLCIVQKYVSVFFFLLQCTGKEREGESQFIPFFFFPRGLGFVGREICDCFFLFFLFLTMKEKENKNGKIGSDWRHARFIGSSCVER